MKWGYASRLIDLAAMVAPKHVDRLFEHISTKGGGWWRAWAQPNRGGGLQACNTLTNWTWQANGCWSGWTSTSPWMRKGNITDDNRIRAALPTINYALDEDAKVIVASHMGRPKGKRVEKFSMAPVARRLGRLLNKRSPGRARLRGTRSGRDGQVHEARPGHDAGKLALPQG